jgi:hypothetical protein
MLFMAAPIIFGGVLFVAVGILVFLVWIGSEANGKHVRMRFSGECTEEAIPLIKARISAVGLGDVSVSSKGASIDVVATLPRIEGAEDSIPRLLIQRGVLSVRNDSNWVFREIEVLSASLEQDESGMPYTKLVLSDDVRKTLEEEVRADPSGFLYFFLDDKQIVKRPNNNLIRSDELRLRSVVGGKRDQMKTTVDWSIALEHGPIPCTMTLKEVFSM